MVKNFKEIKKEDKDDKDSFVHCRKLMFMKGTAGNKLMEINMDNEQKESGYI